MRLYIILAIIFLAGISNAQNVHIKGKSQSYKGKTLTVLSNKDFISELPQKLAETEVDSNGYFELNFSVNSITKIYIPAGYYVIEYMAYPGLKDDILFPRFRSKPKDMYFVPEGVWAKNKSRDSADINNLIFNFDRELSKLTQSHIRRIEVKDKTVLDDIEPHLNKKYSSENAYFKIHKEYSLGLTEFMIDRDYPEKSIEKYFINREIQTENNAYTKMFKNVFYKYISLHQFRKRQGFNGEILYKELYSQIKNKGIENQEICNYIILHILHDACYSPVIKQKIVFEALNYFFKSCGNNKQKSIAHNILGKATRLAEGYKAPVISGYDIKGNIKNSSDFENKYIYMVFYEPANPKCINDLKAIRNIATKHSYIEVMFICDIKKKPACINELKNMNLQNNILFCEDYDKIKNTFRVIVCPEYFMIDKKGDFIKSHTAKPDNHLYKTLNQIYIKEMREGNIKENKYFKR